MSLPQELVEEMSGEFLGFVYKDKPEYTNTKEFFAYWLNEAYQAGLKEGNEFIDKLLEDVEIGHFGTKNRLELIVRLEKLKEGREKV